MQGEARLRGLYRIIYSKTIISVIAWGARFRECSTPSARFNLFENCYSVSAPMNGSTITNTLPLISALVVDTGVGIDPATVEMRLDGQVVVATYITGTGELMYMPPAPLSAGQHTVTVSARDVVGNQASATISFSIGSSQRYIYLPLIRR
jgi:hypothetical protein